MIFDDLIFMIFGDFLLQRFHDFSGSHSRSPKIMKLDHQRSWKMFHFNIMIFGD